VRWLLEQYSKSLTLALNGCHRGKECLNTCVDCQVQFLTSKSNSKRSDLRCPFGCRKRHTQESAAIRSLRRDQKDSAKAKKKELNRKRSLIKPESSKTEQPSIASPKEFKVGAKGGQFSPSSIWDLDILKYIRFLLRTVLGEKLPLIKIENQLKEIFEWILRPRTLQDRGG
jgi:hypothetical protein